MGFEVDPEALSFDGTFGTPFHVVSPHQIRVVGSVNKSFAGTGGPFGVGSGSLAVFDVDAMFVMASCSVIRASGLLFKSIDVSILLVLILMFNRPFAESHAVTVPHLHP